MRHIDRGRAALGGVLLTVAATLAPAPAAGQETVSLEEAVRRALQRSPVMAQQEQAVGNAEAGERQTFGSFLPTLSASSSGSLRSQQRFDSGTDRIVQGSSDSYSAGLSASYTLFAGGRRFADRREAQASVRAAVSRREEQRFQVKLQAETTFFQALRQGDLLAVQEARVRQAEENLEMVRRRRQVGRATISDSLRARLDVVNAQQALLQAETATRAARFALGRQIGEARPVVPQRPDDLDPRPLALTDEEIMALAEQSSPAVIAAAESAAAAAAAVSSAKAAYMPSFTLSSNYNWANQAASFSDGTTSWGLTLRANYPIFNGFQRESSIDRAHFSQVLAGLQRDDALLVAREEADAALHALRTAERAIEIAEEGLAVAQEDLRVVRQRYDVGVATILDVLVSQAAADQASADAVTARYDYILARAQLEAVLGREL